MSKERLDGESTGQVVREAEERKRSWAGARVLLARWLRLVLGISFCDGRPGDLRRTGGGKNRRSREAPDQFHPWERLDGRFRRIQKVLPTLTAAKTTKGKVRSLRHWRGAGGDIDKGRKEEESLRKREGRREGGREGPTRVEASRRGKTPLPPARAQDDAHTR